MEAQTLMSLIQNAWDQSYTYLLPPGGHPDPIQMGNDLF